MVIETERDYWKPFKLNITLYTDEHHYIGVISVSVLTYTSKQQFNCDLLEVDKYARAAFKTALKSVQNEHPTIAYIETFFISYEYRGNGYGPAILHDMLNLLAQNGYPNIDALCVYTAPNPQYFVMSTYTTVNMNQKEQYKMLQSMRHMFSKEGYTVRNPLHWRVMVKNI